LILDPKQNNNKPRLEANLTYYYFLGAVFGFAAMMLVHPFFSLVALLCGIM
jgi:hypothetical protein